MFIPIFFNRCNCNANFDNMPDISTKEVLVVSSIILALIATAILLFQYTITDGFNTNLMNRQKYYRKMEKAYRNRDWILANSYHDSIAKYKELYEKDKYK